MAPSYYRSTVVHVVAAVVTRQSTVLVVHDVSSK
jgi:hypothetical protein